MGDDLCPVGLCWTHHPPPRWGRPAFRFHLRLEGPLPTSELPTNFLLCQRAALCSCGWRPPAWALSTRLGLEGSYSSPEAHAGRRPRAPGRVTVPSYAAKLWGHFSQRAAGPAVEAPRPLIRLLLQDEHASSVSKATSMKYQLWPKETNMLSLACHTTQRCSGWQCCAGPDSALGTAEDPPGMQGAAGMPSQSGTYAQPRGPTERALPWERRLQGGPPRHPMHLSGLRKGHGHGVCSTPGTSPAGRHSGASEGVGGDWGWLPTHSLLRGPLGAVTSSAAQDTAATQAAHRGLRGPRVCRGDILWGPRNRPMTAGWRSAHLPATGVSVARKTCSCQAKVAAHNRWPREHGRVPMKLYSENTCWVWLAVYHPVHTFVMTALLVFFTM